LQPTARFVIIFTCGVTAYSLGSLPSPVRNLRVWDYLCLYLTSDKSKTVKNSRH